jgi:hypothetical protein
MTVVMTDIRGASELRVDITDGDLEAVADESAMLYTYQTSSYDLCCS